jgi:hypothetical protein
MKEREPFFVSCGLPIVLAKPMAHKHCGRLIPEYSWIKTQIMLKVTHSHSSVIQDGCFSTCFALGDVCYCRSATSFTIRCPNSTGFEVWKPFRHILTIHHFFPVD